MHYTKPAVLDTVKADVCIQQTGQNKNGPVPDGAMSSAAGYDADE